MSFYMIFAVTCAYLVKGMCGFANTLVFSTIMSFRAHNIEITPVELVVGYPSNLLIAWKEKKSLSLKVWLPLSLLTIAGSLPGAFLLKNGDTTVIKVLFGFVVVLLALEMLVREKWKEGIPWKKGIPWKEDIPSRTSPLLLGMIGILSGLLCGLFGIGALLAAYVSRTTQDNHSFRGNLCMVFLVENTFRIVLYSLTGIITLSTIKSAAPLFPFMLAGLFIGMFLAKKLKESMVKKVVIIMLLVSGLSLILTNIL